MALYLFIINVLTFIIFGLDKFTAMLQLRRFTVFSLLLLCFAGGIAGGWAGLAVFNHKTRQPVFVKLLWLCTGIWLIPLILYLLNKN